MIFHTPQKKINPLQLKIDNIIIDRVKEFIFLGLTLTEHLNWKSHIDKIANKISRNMGILNKLKHVLPLCVKLHICNSLILSHLNFAFLLGYINIDRIVKLQKKFVEFLASANAMQTPNLFLKDSNY